MQYKTIWNEDHKKLGHKFESQLVNAVLAPLTLYSCFKKTSYADTMIKLAAIWSILNGPSQAVKDTEKRQRMRQQRRTMLHF
jgi:hypothetical protein